MSVSGSSARILEFLTPATARHQKRQIGVDVTPRVLFGPSGCCTTPSSHPSAQAQHGLGKTTTAPYGFRCLGNFRYRPRTRTPGPPPRSFAGDLAEPLEFRGHRDALFSFVKTRRDQPFVERKWRFNVKTIRLVNDTVSVRVNVNSQPSTSACVDIPVTCYQIVGVPDKSEKDQIVKSVLDLRNAEVEEGYTMEAVISRRDLLMDVRDKLLFEPEYAGNMREKIPPKSSLRIPWAWLPGALCLLQEVGEQKLVLDIARTFLQYPDTKPYAHDLVLAMALAECAIAKIHFEKNQVSRGFEALARAQCLLRSKSSLRKMKLLSEIEESLEALVPACTLELLGMPHAPDNAERRHGAIGALRELIGQGLDVESSCQVHDWPSFLSQALGKLMATEIVDLIPWDNLAATRKNKKSLESQNQRVVIDFDCFYIVLMAHIAHGFSCRQTNLISKARSICECLVASEGIDLKLEEAFCLFLLGDGTEAEVLERLQQLQSDNNSASRNSILGTKSKDDLPVSLELWLEDAVLGLFSDTRDCSLSLADFFSSEKKAVGNKQNKGTLQTSSAVSPRLVSPLRFSDRRVSVEHVPSLASSQLVGPAVKQLSPVDLQDPLQGAKPRNQDNTSMSSSGLTRNLAAHPDKAAERWHTQRHFVGTITFVTFLGCIVFATCNLLGTRTARMNMSAFVNNKSNQAIYSNLSSGSWHNGMNDNFPGGMRKWLLILIMRIKCWTDVKVQQKSCLTANLSSQLGMVYIRQMPLEEAEALVRQWQTIKAEALGPDHQVQLLFDILEEQMLRQWQALVDVAQARPCFWRFVLLKLSVLRADILSDNFGSEIAEIDVLLEEAAELVDESQPKNPNYYSTYKISYTLRRQEDHSWKFCKADVEPPSLPRSY